MIENNYPWYNDLRPKALTEDGLIAAYNMIPEKGMLKDISFNGNDGEIYGALSSAEGMKFDGVDDYISNFTVNLGTQNSVLTTINLNDIGSIRTIIGDFVNNAIRLAINNIQVRIGGVSYTFNYDFITDTFYKIAIIRDNTSLKVYINGVLEGESTLSVNSDFVFDNIGRRGLGDLYFSGCICDVLCYNKVLTTQEIEDYHNSFADQVSLKEQFNDEVIGDTLPLHWQPGTGSYEVKEDTEGRYLECTSSGTTSIQSTQVYGEWEFDLYKSQGSSNVNINLINENKKAYPEGVGYYIQLSAGLNEIKLYKENLASAVSLLTTVSGYIIPDVYYSFKITRTIDGEFAVYIKGGSFGDEFVLIDTTGGSGTNPVIDNTYTISQYLVADLDTGDRIRNIVMRKGVKS